MLAEGNGEEKENVWDDTVGETDDPTASLIDKSEEDVVENDADANRVDWSECVVLTLDMFNSFSLLLGVLLFAGGLYIRHMWNQGLSGQGIVFTFLIAVGFFLVLVSLTGIAAVRLTKEQRAATPGSPDSDQGVRFNGEHHQRKKSISRAIIVVYSIFLLVGIVAQLLLGGMMSVFIESMVEPKHRLHPGPVSKQERSTSFTKELQYDFEVWSNCTYTRCCKWKKYPRDLKTRCIADKKPSVTDNDNEEKERLRDMCKGWPISRKTCKAGVADFQRRSAQIMNGYFQPMLVFLVINAFLQLLVLVFAVLELMSSYSAQMRARRRGGLN